MFPEAVLLTKRTLMDSERLVLFAIPFHGVRRRGTTEKANVNSCVALVEEHFGSRFIIHPADLKSKGEYRREKKQKNWNSNN